MEMETAKILKILDKNTAWLKRNPRAFHFYLFRVCSLISEGIEKNIIHNAGDSTGSSIYQRYNAFNREISTGPYSQASPDIIPWSQDLPAELKETIDKQSGIVDAISKNETSLPIPLSSQKENPGTEKQTQKEQSGKIPPENIRNANGLLFNRIKNITEKKIDFSLFVDLLRSFVGDLNTISALIFSLDKEWREQYDAYPSPFSWVNSKDEIQCQWLWRQMRERCLGIPLKPIDSKQKFYFICAIFDNWKGWTGEQEDYLNSKNSKRKKGKFLGNGISQEEGFNINHKDILLDELKKAWEQKVRRARKADKDIPISLTKIARKKLEFIASVNQSTPEATLRELINHAFLQVKDT
ncbi:hypothetical protein P9911_025015 [Klebsiella oxytoca]|uniref:hypothetical protein n=1 Tax=Enterobacteriaceae TaxID=543 RepID=UPI001A29D300|nr:MULTISPECIES: hypothetical protein [Enterobacteriaceae]MEC5509096.1 hypothetical protein [Klebsiella oxytoca]HAT1594146.1 hypothetical protein [Klebsiella oxytoca]